jgi:hypothetical protein
MDFERWMKEGSFTGETLRYVKQGSEMAVYFHTGPGFGEHRWAFLLEAFLSEEFLLGPLEI